MQPNAKKVWFPAKKYGWGWGLPCSWQGWVVMVVWMILTAAGALAIGPEHPGYTIAFVTGLSCVLVAICWIKGEKPRWRWGND